MNLTILLVKNFNPNELSPGHDCFHKSEVEAPDHDECHDNCQWNHNNPVLNVVKTEYGAIISVFNAIIISVDLSVTGEIVFSSLSVILF